VSLWRCHAPLAILCALVGCATDVPGRGQPVCTPGLTAACSCADGTEGVHSCTLGGDAYGGCQCAAPPEELAGVAGQPATDPPPPGGDEVVVDDGGPGPVEPPAGPRGMQPDNPLPPGKHTLQIEVGGRTRVFDLVVPDNYDNSGPVPLVVNFHGFTLERVAYEGITLYGRKGAAEGFAVATPDGVDRSWNGGSACCGNASAGLIDDVGFARAMVEEIGRGLWYDPGKVYAVGFSNGSFLAHRLGCEASDVFTAVATAAGGLSLPDVLPGCAPGRGVPVVTYFGTRDTTYATLGDTTHRRWLEVNACTDSGHESYRNGGAVCTTYSACRDGAELTRCIIDGMDHCWPAGPCQFPQSPDLHATDHSWQFLSGFTM